MTEMMWSEASGEIEAEGQRREAAYALADAETCWPFLSVAQTQAEYADRKAMLAGSADWHPAVHEAFDARFAEQQRTAAAEALKEAGNKGPFGHAVDMYDWGYRKGEEARNGNPNEHLPTDTDVWENKGGSGGPINWRTSDGSFARGFRDGFEGKPKKTAGSLRDFMNEKSGKTGTCKHCGKEIEEFASGGWQTKGGGAGADICIQNRGTKTQYGGEHQPKRGKTSASTTDVDSWPVADEDWCDHCCSVTENGVDICDHCGEPMSVVGSLHEATVEEVLEAEALLAEASFFNTHHEDRYGDVPAADLTRAHDLAEQNLHRDRDALSTERARRERDNQHNLDELGKALSAPHTSALSPDEMFPNIPPEKRPYKCLVCDNWRNAENCPHCDAVEALRDLDRKRRGPSLVDWLAHGLFPSGATAAQHTGGADTGTAWAIIGPDNANPLWNKTFDSEAEAQTFFDRIKGRTDDLVPRNLASFKVAEVTLNGPVWVEVGKTSSRHTGSGAAGDVSDTPKDPKGFGTQRYPGPSDDLTDDGNGESVDLASGETEGENTNVERKVDDEVAENLNSATPAYQTDFPKPAGDHAPTGENTEPTKVTGTRRMADNLFGDQEADEFAQPVVPKTTRPRVTPEPPRDLFAAVPQEAPNVLDPVNETPVAPLNYARPTFAQTVAVRVAKVAAQVREDNPHLSDAAVNEIALTALSTYPQMVRGGN